MKINQNENENNKKLSLLLTILILPSFQGFSSRETNFYFHQFLSNFLKYFSSNFSSSHPYNIFAINFSDNSPLLRSFSSTISSFSCLLTSTFILSSNFSSAFFACPRSSPFFYMSCSAVNPFVRCSSHQGGSLQNGLGDERTCGTTLASAYVLCCLSAMWLQLQMIGRSLRWEWVLIGVSPLNTGDWVQ